MLGQFSTRLLAAVAVCVTAIPLPGFAAAEMPLIWTERSSGGLTTLAYGPLDPAQDPLFLLSCFNGMSIAVLDVHKEHHRHRARSAPHHRDIIRPRPSRRSRARWHATTKRGATFGEASNISVKPVLEVLRDPGPLTIKMGETSATLSDQGGRRRSANSAKTARSISLRRGATTSAVPRVGLPLAVLAKRGENRGDDARGVEPRLLVHGLRLVLLDESSRAGSGSEP